MDLGSAVAYPHRSQSQPTYPKLSEPILCTIQEVDYESTAKYEGLSYVWGTSPSRPLILLNGGEFSVGEKLEAMLRQLRPRDGQGRALWIDAVHINQDNRQEKAYQVAWMDSVYNEASSILVWLVLEPNVHLLRDETQAR